MNNLKTFENFTAKNDDLKFEFLFSFNEIEEMDEDADDDL